MCKHIHDKHFSTHFSTRWRVFVWIPRRLLFDVFRRVAWDGLRVEGKSWPSDLHDGRGLVCRKFSPFPRRFELLNADARYMSDTRWWWSACNRAQRTSIFFFCRSPQTDSTGSAGTLWNVQLQRGTCTRLYKSVRGPSAEQGLSQGRGLNSGGTAAGLVTVWRR